MLPVSTIMTSLTVDMTLEIAFSIRSSSFLTIMQSDMPFVMVVINASLGPNKNSSARCEPNVRPTSPRRSDTGCRFFDIRLKSREPAFDT